MQDLLAGPQLDFSKVDAFPQVRSRPLLLDTGSLQQQLVVPSDTVLGMQHGTTCLQHALTTL